MKQGEGGQKELYNEVKVLRVLVFELWKHKFVYTFIRYIAHCVES